MARAFNRRTFLMGALAAPALTPSIARAVQEQKLRVAVIGVGGQGAYTWSNLTSEEMVMLCDVDLARVADAAKQYPKAEVVQDFRRVLDRKDIDAVAVCTPDHWHAIPTVWAMQTGKHVYCEKPLGHSVYETRVMAEVAKEKKRVTQMGTQIHSGGNYRRVVELVQAGAIGPVRRVDVWCERSPDRGKLGPQGTAPSTLDYDLWLGPAPERPFNSQIVPFGWRWWWEFGGGVLADMACHFMDLPHWALGLRHPERVKAEGTTFTDADNTVPNLLKVDFHYPARGSQPPVHLVWWHGTPGPRDDEGKVRSLHGFGSGVLFTGEKGQIISDYGRHMLLPEEQFKDYQRPSPTIPDSVGHHREWINAIKNGGPTTCNFDYSGALTETVHLGNVSFRLGGKELHWDPKRLRVTNLPESEWKPLIRREYRGDWKLKR
ncbi:MAG: Gfo/Idh/MocA family protein [Armatimonadota bacterium]